ncbi:HTH-type transcriptional regulator DegA [Abditibacteriota bacterium]|nr:HTH-type transcriptional regulator DegA [Abditibacteriota bacterium]
MRTETSRPTIHDVARQTGLSIATVSRALHMTNSPNVSETTRERVKEAARLLGYQPNLMGRSLVTGRSNTISYWALSLFSPYYTRITENICREAARRHYHVVINGTNDPAHSFEDDGAGAGSGNPLASHFDGIIACDVAYQQNDYASELRGRSRPFVGIGLNTPPQSDSVTIDVLAAGYMATKHLIEAGAQRILLLTADRGQDPRTTAYESVMREAGRETTIVRISHNRRPNAREGIKAMIEEYRSLGRTLPDAIFCQNDEVAIGCCRGLFDLGIKVPDDVLLIGCDGLDETEYAACPLSTVAFPISEMCSTAWDFLEHRLQSLETEQQNVVLQPQIIQRQSTRT